MSIQCTQNHEAQKPGDSRLDKLRAARLILAYLDEDPQSPSLILANEVGDCTQCAHGVAWAAAGFAGGFAERVHGGQNAAMDYAQRLVEVFIDDAD